MKYIIAAAIAAVGVGAYLNSSKSVGLSCDITYAVTMYTGGENAKPYESTSQVTTIIQLSGDTWRYVSWDGHSWRQMAEHVAKAEEKPFHASDLDHHLTTTAEEYTLYDIDQEEIVPTTVVGKGAYRKHRSGVIDRLTGAINMSEKTTQDKDPYYSDYETQVGKCTPITIQANI